ncbi:hypothetical protein [uncultured Tateyamaria sp.]|uniref:VpaChn25_0724 family phage protein n=1 Tax=uncultured Tateyamaria sp. TaxID=455651 RepID=UPI00260A9D9E|nr:hypothetical protein [uncultured Tateyamaria sp.]
MAEIEKEKRRGAILRHLAETTGDQLSLDMLKIGCGAMGIPSNIDQVENAVVWLSEQGLAEMNKLGHMKTARLLPDGREVVEGLRTIRGILDPMAKG